MDKEIAELEAKEERTPQEDDRLRSLCLEREFQRRLREVHKVYCIARRGNLSHLFSLHLGQ